MKIYTGIDLHSNNSYVALINEEGKIIYKKRLPNDLEVLLEELKPYQDCIEGVVIESTYNWYWLVDGLQEAGYKVHLANPGANEQYSGIKHANDENDAIWLANLLRLKTLRTGYIYPKEKRGIRELLRKRLLLVRQQTANLLSIQGMITRYENVKVSGSNIKTLNTKKILSLVKDENAKFAVQSQLKILNCIIEQVDVLEREIQKKIRSDQLFILLKSVPGIGPILAMTILLETGDLNRFETVGNYSSYCRCVESKRVSNEKKKGTNNRKNGNAYLCWAFIEASNQAIRSYPEINKYYQRKLNKTMRVVALKTIANKLSKACYFILRDKVEFDMKKLFM
ncbi:MAG TPA: IS110 family transposase [Coxiellaceae bacterium]|nr:IS110 family transposase [Coxiellaceae bacterium]HBY55463.1 IS110 family transposase [Coxiellaceae bacterium]